MSIRCINTVSTIKVQLLIYCRACGPRDYHIACENSELNECFSIVTHAYPWHIYFKTTDDISRTKNTINLKRNKWIEWFLKSFSSDACQKWLLQFGIAVLRWNCRILEFLVSILVPNLVPGEISVDLSFLSFLRYVCI